MVRWLGDQVVKWLSSNLIGVGGFEGMDCSDKEGLVVTHLYSSTKIALPCMIVEFSSFIHSIYIFHDS